MESQSPVSLVCAFTYSAACVDDTMLYVILFTGVRFVLISVSRRSNKSTRMHVLKSECESTTHSEHIQLHNIIYMYLYY